MKVEAQFEVGEYEIVILSAKDALGLDIWLKENKYKIPAERRAAAQAVRAEQLEVLRGAGRTRRR